jgi:polyisoprenoid-binding protein YceI
MNRKLITIIAIVFVVGAGTAYGIFALQSTGSPPPASLSPTDSEPDPAVTVNTDDIEGEWTVAPGDSFVGYRVREKLAFLPAPNDAVGRTSTIEGTMTVSATAVENGTITADLRDLSSDESRRDQTIRTTGLESESFPEAIFELTSPIDLGSTPEAGTVIETTIEGTLTLHGVTNEVEIPVEARLSQSGIEVAGSLEIQFADYDITPPSVGPATVEDHGTMEFKVLFIPA